MSWWRLQNGRCDDVCIAIWNPCKQDPFAKKILIGTTNSGIYYQPRYIYSIHRCLWYVATYKWKFQSVKTIISRKVSFLTVSHCQFPCVSQGIKQNILFLRFKLNVIDAINIITHISIISRSQLNIYGEGNPRK
jgi:hypothetical protein